MRNKVEARFKFWNNNAKLKKLAGTKDYNAKIIEIEALSKFFKKNIRVLEFGCGNGCTALELAKRFNVKIDACDYSPEMISEAKKMQKKKRLFNGVRFFLADIKKKLEINPIYDLVFTERMLINLDSWRSQKKSIIKLVNCLKPKGSLVLMENSATGLKIINDYRSMLGLKKIKAPWHNLYLDDKRMLNFKIKNCKLIEVIPYSSTYYFLSRVVNASLANEKGMEPNYNAKINKLAFKLPSISDCAQGKIYLYKKIS
jgi:ubiquinone/menaquinone biosynthesis C-methylase UbiE